MNFTGTLFDLRDFDAAYAVAARTSELYARSLPAGHPRLLNCLENLAIAEGFRRNYVDAVSHFREAIAILDQQGRPDPNTPRPAPSQPG